jgi:hypothetical protein
MPKLEDSLREFQNKPKKEPVYITGFLGIKISGVQTVVVPNRPGFVYVRLLNAETEYIEAYNGVVSPIYDLPVKIVRDVNWYRIFARDTARYQNWGLSPYFPPHSHSHEMDFTGGGGGDIVWVRQQQFYPMNIMPGTGTNSDSVSRLHHAYFWNNAWKWAGDTGTSNLLGCKPTDDQMRLLLVCTNMNTGNPTVVTGSLVSSALFGYEDLLATQWPPDFPYYYMPHAGVALLSGTASIEWSNLYDVRQFFLGNTVTGSSGGAVTEVTAVAPIISSGGTAPSISISDATQADPGSMSAADKTKLDGMPESIVKDEVYGPSWDGQTGTSPSMNAI